MGSEYGVGVGVDLIGSVRNAVKVADGERTITLRSPCMGTRTKHPRWLHVVDV